jgi:outer membrane protein assembly factor BamB
MELRQIQVPHGPIGWTFGTNGRISASPAIVDTTVYFGSTDGYLYAVDAQSGEQKYREWTERNLLSAIAVADGRIYCQSDYDLTAFNIHTGQKLWSQLTPLAGEHSNFTASSPAVANGVVYVGGYACTSNRVIWHFDPHGEVIVSSPAVANGIVYVGAGKALYALDPKTGTSLWSYMTDASVVSSPAVQDGIVYVGSSDGNLYAFGLP